MGISGIGQNYYHNNVATARNTKNVNSTGKNDGFAGKVTEKNPVSPEDMTFEEYKAYFNEKMDALYTHPSQRNMNWVIDITDMKKIQEADKRWLCILFGIPYEAEYQGEGTGSALHIYNEEGEEVLTYTQGVGWHEKETKAETGVHSALKLAYYEAYHDAKKALNTGTNVEITNENVVVQSNFDVKA